MDFNIFTTIFLIFATLFIVISWYLNYIQTLSINDSYNEVPKKFSDKISLLEHQKAAKYNKTNINFSYIEIAYGVLLILLWTLFGGFNLLDNYLSTVVGSELLLGVSFIISFMIISSALELPFSYYKVFSIEESFGFNKMTKKTFIVDLLKELLLTLLFGVPIVLMVLYLMNISGDLWWLFVWLLFVVISLITLFIYPKYIAPIFNKFSPLADEELTEKITSLLTKTSFSSSGVFVMDGSKRSSHGNAYFTGFGKNKRIVFFDTLLKNLSHKQILAVIAHELGHFHHKHVRKKMFVSFTMMLLLLAILGYLINQTWFYNGLGVTNPSNYVALVLFLLTIPVFIFLISPIYNFLSRKHEYEADNFAAKHTNNQDLISALISLYTENASTLTPNKYYSLFYDSHPSASLRIDNLETNI